MSLPWAPWPFWLLLWVRRAQGASFQNIQLPLAEEIPDLRIVVKNCDVLKGKHFFRNHLYTNWQFRIPGLALNGSEHHGGQIKPFWWEASPELKPGRSLDGGKVLQRFQQISDFEGSKLLTAGKGWGESTSEPFSKEHNQLGAGKGRLFLLHVICVGISNKENPENSLLEVVAVQPWISPDLPLVVIITLSLQGTHNFQIWLGSPKLEEPPADVGKHQGQRKGGEMLEFPSSITAFCPAKQQRFNCLFKQHKLSEILSFLGIAWAPESLCEAFPCCCCCRGKSALGKLLMVQNLSLSDLQPAVYPSHFAPGKEQIFIEMFFLIQNIERGEKCPNQSRKGWENTNIG